MIDPRAIPATEPMMKRWCCLAVCWLSLTTGCASAVATLDETEAETWPRISIELRYIVVDEMYLEEFGVDFEAWAGLDPRGSADAFVARIDDTEENLLVTATLAQQNSLSHSLDRLMLLPGEPVRCWTQPNAIFFHDIGNEHLASEGGLGFEVVADRVGESGPDAPLRVLLIARPFPEGVRHGKEMEWVERRGAEGVAVYPAPTLRVQMTCGSGETYLAAWPTPGPDAEDRRRRLLLITPTFTASPEMENTLFPGLEGGE